MWVSTLQPGHWMWLKHKSQEQGSQWKTSETLPNGCCFSATHGSTAPLSPFSCIFPQIILFPTFFFRMNSSFPLLENQQLSPIIYKRQIKILIWHSDLSRGCQQETFQAHTPLHLSMALSAATRLFALLWMQPGLPALWLRLLSLFASNITISQRPQLNMKVFR